MITQNIILPVRSEERHTNLSRAQANYEKKRPLRRRAKRRRRTHLKTSC